MTLNLPKIEEGILKFWQEKKIFERSLAQRKKGPRFIFFEGPPFANGLPGIHHLLARAFKDIILRYKTMRGFYVERRAGWDTHGLPTEMEAEKKLGIKSKKEIEKLGIEKFIEECKRNVFTYKKEWEEFTERIGFWLDFKNAYITCDNDYIETLWWILKQIWQKGLLYQDYKVVPYCPRCGTSLSSHEVAQGYKTVTEKSITVKFELVDEPGTYVLVWTTTPWTLPGNVVLAVNPNIDYIKFSLKNYPGISDGIYITSKKDFNDYKNEIKKIGSESGAKVKITKEVKGKDLIGNKYKSLYNNKAPYKIIGGDFISVEEGTGVVHIAPAFGEDDMKVGKENDLPVLTTVDKEGKMLTTGYPWHGKFIKEADSLIIQDLKNRDLVFYTEDYEHEYPFCWRCKTPLLYYAKNSWFIKMADIKEELIKNSKNINWEPEYIKKGRFGEWLKEVKDWNLSRERYWGTPLPIWQCSKCKKQICIGGIKELEELSSQRIEDLHRPFIDKVVFNCQCGGTMRRVLEVIDCWFDSGSMPFSQWHYPFENREKIDKKEFFPADFISEGIDQTRGWFYTLLAVSTLLEKGASYKNVICLGLILDAEGQKMSKSKGNIIEPKEVINKFGADCVRLYFYTVNPVAEPKRFDFKDIQNLYRKFFDTLWQSYSFFETYVSKKEIQNSKATLRGVRFASSKIQNLDNVLDRWIISRLENLNFKVIENLDKYDVVSSARLFLDFVDDLSNWYIRRSRQRFKNSNKPAAQTLYYILLKGAKLLSPFTPFFAEELYQKLSGEKESVHLEEYPEPNKKLINKKLEEKMIKVREITTEALAQRAKAGIKVRQPLALLQIKNKLEKELLELIKDEVNVKKITFGKKIKLNTKITKELREEGIIRDVVRHIQEMRKKAGFKPKDKIIVESTFEPTDLESFKEQIGAKEFNIKEKVEGKEITLGRETYYIKIKKYGHI